MKQFIIFLIGIFVLQQSFAQVKRVEFKTSNRIWNNSNTKSKSKNLDAIKTTIVIAPSKKRPKNGNYKDTLFVNSASYVGKFIGSYQPIDAKKSQYIWYFECDDNDDSFSFAKVFFDKNKKPIALSMFRRLKFPTTVTYYNASKKKLKLPIN